MKKISILISALLLTILLAVNPVFAVNPNRPDITRALTSYNLTVNDYDQDYDYYYVQYNLSNVDFTDSVFYFFNSDVDNLIGLNDFYISFTMYYDSNGSTYNNLPVQQQGFYTKNDIDSFQNVYGYLMYDSFNSPYFTLYSKSDIYLDKEEFLLYANNFILPNLYVYHGFLSEFNFDLVRNSNDSVAYQNGYQKGLLDGSEQGYNLGYLQGKMDFGFFYDNEYQNSNIAYQLGLSNASKNILAIRDFIPGILGMLFMFFFQISQISIIGISLLDIISVIVGIGALILIVRIIFR